MHAYLNILANIVITRYFQEFPCIVLIKNTRGDIINTPESVARIIFDASEIRGRDSCEILKSRCPGFIINSDQAPAILNFLEQKLTKCSIGGFNGRKYLVFSTGQNDEESFSPAILDYLKDILIVRPSKTRPDQLRLLSNRFVGKRGNSAKWILLDVWINESQGFIYNADLYPEKTRDLKGKTIKLSTFSYFPYSMVGETFDRSSGIEMILIREFLRKHRARATLMAREDEEWGEAFDNQTGYGVIGDVITTQSDVGFAAIFMWPNVYQFSDFTASTLQIRVKCLVPKSKLEYNWLSVWVYFSVELWVLLAIVLFLSSIPGTFRAMLRRSSSLRKNLWRECGLFEVYGVMVSQTVDMKLSKQRSALFLLLNLFSVIMGALYGSGIASRMVIPKNVDEINTVGEMAEKNLKWGTTQKLWLASIIQDERKEYQKIIENFVEKNKTELTKLGRTADFGFPVDQLPSGFIALQNYFDEPILERLRLMKGNIYTEHVVFLTRKNYVLLPALNDFILRVQQSGLMHIWEAQATASEGLHLQYVVKYARKGSKNVVLEWRHVKGVFATWFIGMIVSILIFVLECKK